MIKINNYIQCAFDGVRKLVKEDQITHVVVHRISFEEDKNSIFGPIKDEDLTGLLVAARFREQGQFTAGSYTGGNQPYQLFTRRNGEIDQLARLTDVSPHARAFSKKSIGWSFAGDFRTKHITYAQENAFHDLGILLRDFGLTIVTHDSLPGVSKICPGALFGFYDKLGEIERFRADSPISKNAAREALIHLGIEI